MPIPFVTRVQGCTAVAIRQRVKPGCDKDRASVDMHMFHIAATLRPERPELEPRL
jgi:hypothetical protein